MKLSFVHGFSLSVLAGAVLMVVHPSSAMHNPDEPVLRRVLEERFPLVDNEDEWIGNRAKCDNEDYELFLFVYGHLAFAAIPVNLKDSDCRTVTLDVVSDGHVLQKRKRLYEDSDRIETDYDLVSSLHKIGQFKLKEITTAFEESVEAGSAGDYDVFDNNCISPIYQVGHALGIEVDNEMAEFIIVRLLETGKITEKVRKHPLARKLFENIDVDSVPGRKLVEAVVQHGVAKYSSA